MANDNVKPEAECRTVMSKETKAILSTIRRAWARYPERYVALNRAKLSYGVYRCEKCLEPKRRKAIQVDHIEPVVEPTAGLVDIETYIKRLFCKSTGLQILCKPCHKLKSGAENVIRIGMRRTKKREST